MAHIFIFGDNVDTDVIIPARFLTQSTPAHLSAHCMEDIDPNFAKKVQVGDIIVAGKNFGCGSSREHAPLALKASGICAVIACSFARIFYRNCINIGLPIVECSAACLSAHPNDDITLDLEHGVITNHTQNLTFYAEPMADFQKEIIRRGGLMNL